MRLRAVSGLLAACCAGTAFALAVTALHGRPRVSAQAEMQVALPRFAQVIMAGGDRFLAANIAGFRALVASTETMGPENYRIQGIVQQDVAWFNPAHEDNYYVAAAILSWNGQLAAAQEILRRASVARPFDAMPAFYHAFNVLHFEKDPVAASRWLLTAAEQTADPKQRVQLQNLAAYWVAKGEDVEFAIRFHREMARTSANKAFAAHLEKRAVRLENLLELQRAVERYRERSGADPADLQELVRSGVLPNIPDDPLGGRYVIGKGGRPQVQQAKPKEGKS